MGARRIRREQIQHDQKVSRKENGIVKVKERSRREARLIAAIKGKPLPYIPPIMSWLSAKLDKPSRLITQAEVDHIVK